MFLFVLIAAGSSLGTFIQQHEAGSKSVFWLSEKFHTSHEQMYVILSKIGLVDIYGSWWFIALLLLFALNLIVCTFNRLPHVYRQLKTPVGINRDIFETSKNTVTFEAPEDAEEKIQGYLKNFGFVSETEDSVSYFAAEKGRFSRSGVYITHLGIIIVLAAALIGITAGFKGNIAIVEGSSDDVIITPAKKEVKLPFSIQLDNFDVDYYKDSIKPEKYVSDITIINGDKKEHLQLLVNTPVNYKGYRIFQTNHGFYAGDNVLFMLQAGKADKTSNIHTGFGQKFSIPETNLTAIVQDFAPSLGQDEKGRLVNFNTMMMNPAVLLEVFDENEVSLGYKWIFQKHEESGDMKDFKVKFVDVLGAQYSVLTVSKDPGKLLIYIGFIILSIGVIVAFYFRHTRIWVRVEKNGSVSRVSVAADRSKYKSAVGEDIDRLRNFILK